MSGFTEQDVVRDVGGRFDEKVQSPPEVSLEGGMSFAEAAAHFSVKSQVNSWDAREPDDSAGRRAQLDDMVTQSVRRGQELAPTLRRSERESLSWLSKRGIGLTQAEFIGLGYPFDPTRKLRGRRRLESLVEKGLVYRDDRGEYRATIAGSAASDDWELGAPLPGNLRNRARAESRTPLAHRA